MTERRIDARNLTAQLHFRAAGNPPGAEPDSVPSNCYPGVELDVRNLWSRLFEGIELHEAENYVTAGEGELARLVGRRLLRVAGHPTVVQAFGPRESDGVEAPLTHPGNPDGAWTMEWSNSMASVLKESAGKFVTCEFTREEAPVPLGVPDDPEALEAVELRVRPVFARSEGEDLPLAVVDESVWSPGELTDSLCSPWQRDFRGCFCYYWAATRPDFVNVETDDRGASVGINWIAVDRESKEYVPDADVDDPRLYTYSDLYWEWERLLRFVVGGEDAE